MSFLRNMELKYRLFLFATTFAILFTTFVYIIPKYKMLWLSLEVIILPLIYYVGYEMMMDNQKGKFEENIDFISNKVIDLKEKFEESIDFISSKMIDLDNENRELKLKLKYSKRKK
jgi:hypothetical protein